MRALPSRLPCSGIAIAIVAGNGNDFFCSLPPWRARPATPATCRFPPVPRPAPTGRDRGASATSAPRARRSSRHRPPRRLRVRLATAAVSRCASALRSGQAAPYADGAAYREATESARRGRVSRACKPVAPCGGRALRLWARPCPPRLSARAGAEGNAQALRYNRPRSSSRPRREAWPRIRTLAQAQKLQVETGR